MRNSKLWVKIAIVLVLLGLFAAKVWDNYTTWEYLESLPRFHDVTIELGDPLPDITAFMNGNAEMRYLSMATDPETVVLDQVGQQTLYFTYKDRQEAVTLTIQDTTAPEATFQDVYTTLGTELTLEDFKVEYSDLSDCTVAFAGPITQPRSYADVTVDILVTDASGNVTTGTCHVYYVWMIDSFQLELGQNVYKTDLLLDPRMDALKLEQSQLDAVNAAPVGTYTVTSTDGHLSCECTITVVDTTAPTLELQALSFYPGGTASLEDFVVSATDASGEVELRLLTELDFITAGVQTVVIEAEDCNGNVTTGETTLTILTDTTPPTIYGLTDMTVEKYSTPDYETGVYAYDDRSGYVSVSVDASRVNLTARGTYYVTYTARDAAGNVATARRKITVNHDAADTAALVAQIAATLPDDAESVRDYVRNLIWYNGSQYGGGDPVWYGLNYHNGNCYVYANVLKALLEAKGYTTQLIWVTDYSHYWLQVYLNGKWVHMDATVGRWHSRYSIMNDTLRYETLNGRDWDRSAWPACE